MSVPVWSARPARAMARPRRRGLRLRTVLFWIVVVLVAAAVVGDRVAARYATNELRARLVAELSRLDVQYASLDVVIGGFPFLTQVVRGSYTDISIDMTEIRIPNQAGRRATLSTLHVVGDGVDANAREVLGGRPKINARQVTGTVTVPFGTLETIADYAAYGWSAVTYAEVDGGLRATGVYHFAGLGIPVAAMVDLSVVEGQIQVKLRDFLAVNLALPLPAAATDSLSALAQRSVAAQLPSLPFGLVLHEVTVQPSGLAVIATGRDVALLG